MGRMAAVLSVVVAAACGGGSVTRTETVQLPAIASGQPTDSHLVLTQHTGKDERGAAVPIGDDPTWGSRTALVTIVEFEDFQCPFCSRSAETVSQLERDYGPEKLRLVFKHEPLTMHAEARPCADAAETVHQLGGNVAFWKFYDLAFHDQQNLNAQSYETWARVSGVALPAFRDAMATHRFAQKVDDDLELGKQLGVNGTPAFYINGISLGGAQPAEKFHTIIDAEIAASNARLAKGTPAEDLYTVASKENFAKGDDDDDDADTKTVWKIPVGSSPELGPKTALVTIIEFSDFQCPYCKRVQPALKQVKSTYGADVRVVFKHEPLPFHPRAEPAAELALEARAEKGDTGFWDAHDKLFDSQPSLDDADLDKIGADLKLDAAKVTAARTTKKYARTIDQDQALAEDFQASGTPHFFVNGRRLVGAQPFDKFKSIIDEELVKARALVAAGTKPEKVYDELTKTGKMPPPPEQKTITFTGAAPVKGSGTVTIVEIADFQCPHCKAAEDSLTEVLKAYPNKVKVVWRHMPLPFHAQAELAAEASVEAFKQKGNDGFWKMHDALLAHQADQDGLERANIDSYARTLGLDMTRFKNALDTGANASPVDADKRAASNAAITGTPAFLIGTGNATGTWTAYTLAGGVTGAKLKKLIDLSLGAHP